MNYFLIDYENVNVAGFDGVSKLTEEDCVIIFYSENAETMTFGLHRRINESKANFKFQKVDVKEKNALDFQLCTYLGFLIRDTMTDDANKNFYYIVSNDKGYSVLPDYLKKFGVEVHLVSNLAKNSVVSQETKIVSNSSTKNISEFEMALRKVLNTTDVAEIAQNIKNFKTKTEINNYLCKKFDSQNGGKIYRAIKTFLSDKK